jgi:hypothetical protein
MVTHPNIDEPNLNDRDRQCPLLDMTCGGFLIRNVARPGRMDDAFLPHRFRLGKNFTQWSGKLKYIEL